MDAKYKIYFSGEFKEWVERDEFIHAFSHHLSVSKKKAAALFEVERKVILKKNLCEVEADRHVAAFRKMGMIVTKKLMMKPFVGPRIELQSKMVEDERSSDSEPEVDTVTQRKRGISNLASGLKSLMNRGGA
jgi:hypothetical protein